jgi:hypothetical protein
VATVDTGNLPSYCEARAGDIDNDGSNDETIIHCYLSSMRITTDIDVRTSPNRALYLYFDDEGSVLNTTGSNTITHTNTGTFASDNERDAASIRQLRLFGCREASGGGCRDIPMI